MAHSGAKSGTSTATLRLAVGDLKIAQPVSVPAGPVRAAQVIPALQGVVNALVDAAEKSAVEMGKTISCRKGCGACCRQLVPISRTEGERLLDEIKALPPNRQQRLREKFAQAEAKIAEAHLFSFSSPPPGGAEKREKTDRKISVAYFALGIPCPFLEDESCSIHPVRPLVCREYLVTSPAELCAGAEQDGVAPVAVPKVSMAARKLQDDSDDWFPLAMLLAWARTRPRDGRKRPGMEWIQRFVQRLTVR
ncbi:MAG TPA: YkgJ family cysteine cluster protein [Reyranella sp.]|nr:YkgJ family cysteine cluster protein [Reyranella sp.]